MKDEIKIINGKIVKRMKIKRCNEKNEQTQI